MSTYTRSRARCQGCSVTHTAVNECCGQWCDASHGNGSWTKAGKAASRGAPQPPGTSTSCWHSLGARGVWDLWELLWVHASELCLSQKGNPWTGHGGSRQSFLEAISISLCPFHLVLGARWHTQGAVSLAGLTLASVKTAQPPFQHRTGLQRPEVGAVSALHPVKTVDGQQGLMC